MKLKRCLLIIGCLVSANLFAQTPKAIEADLLKSFKQINEWSIDTGMNANESLWKAKKKVGEKLYHYASQYPATIAYPFNLLKKSTLISILLKMDYLGSIHGILGRAVLCIFLKAYFNIR
jgi:hypothetical protein